MTKELKTKTQQKYEKHLDQFAYEMSKGSLYVQLRSAKIVLGKALQEQAEEKDKELQAQKEKFEEVLNKLDKELDRMIEITKDYDNFVWEEGEDLHKEYKRAIGDFSKDVLKGFKFLKNFIKEALNNHTSQILNNGEHVIPIIEDGNVSTNDVIGNTDKTPSSLRLVPTGGNPTKEDRGSNICECRCEDWNHYDEKYECMTHEECKKFTPRGKK